MLLLKKTTPTPDITIRVRDLLDERDSFSRIRCPLCAWQPAASDLWSCVGPYDGPDLFDGCGATWNTFATYGRCPGCSHQWKYTMCLQCQERSRHEDWYEEGE